MFKNKEAPASLIDQRPSDAGSDRNLSVFLRDKGCPGDDSQEMQQSKSSLLFFEIPDISSSALPESDDIKEGLFSLLRQSGVW